MGKTLVTVELDGSKTETVIVGLVIGDKRYKRTYTRKIGSAKFILSLFVQLLSKHGLSLGDITQVHVSAGPGSFTGLRVAFAIGQMLAWVLQIPFRDFDGMGITTVNYGVGYGKRYGV